MHEYAASGEPTLASAASVRRLDECAQPIVLGLCRVRYQDSMRCAPCSQTTLMCSHNASCLATETIAVPMVRDGRPVWSGVVMLARGWHRRLLRAATEKLP